MKLERTDRLRRRPETVRYFYLAQSESNLHTGLSHGGLNYVDTNHKVTALWLADLVKGKVIEVKEPVHDFMNRWRANYNNPDWDYEKEIAEGIPAPKI